MKPFLSTKLPQTLLALMAILVANMTCQAQEKERPPFHGTIFLSPKIITDNDPSTFEELKYSGQEERRMFDRRTNGWITDKPFLFVATFSDKLTIEFQVNSEFKDKEKARELAERFAIVIGRLPRCLRTDVKTSWIHDGKRPFGGGNQNLLIHVDQADAYQADGILEETLVHEASHTSLDSKFAREDLWKKAQQEDGQFISNYAMENPVREDVAETFLLWLALRHRPESLTDAQRKSIQETVPHRLTFFDSQSLVLAPWLQDTEQK